MRKSIVVLGSLVFMLGGGCAYPAYALDVSSTSDCLVNDAAIEQINESDNSVLQSVDVENEQEMPPSSSELEQTVENDDVLDSSQSDPSNQRQDSREDTAAKSDSSDEVNTSDVLQADEQGELAAQEEIKNGWIESGGKKQYYVDDALASGELCVDGKWYYFDPEEGCAAATGVTDLGYKTVCYAADGHMLYGEQRVGDGWYHFDAVTGKMSTGLTDLGYKTVLYGDDGRMLYGAQDVPGRGKCYFDGVTGALVGSGWVSLGGSRCYVADGALASGELCVDGKWYYFDPEEGCAAATGVTDLGYKTVCYAADGHMLYGEQRVGDGWYHFDAVTGKMSTGLTDLGYKTVLYGDDGRMLYGAQDVPGRGKCYFDGVTGALVGSI